MPTLDAEYGELDGAHVLAVGRYEQRPTREKSTLRFHNLCRAVGNLSDEKLYRAGYVEVLFPLFWMAKQNKNPRNDNDPIVKERDKGRDIGYEYVARTLWANGAQRITSFNPHFHRTAGKTEIEVFKYGKIDIFSLSAVPQLAEYAKNEIDKDSIIIGPDLRAHDLSKEFCKCVGIDNEHCFEKTRDNKGKAHIFSEYDAYRKPVIIVDDMAETFGTAEKAIRRIKNPAYIDVRIIHPILPEDGHDLVRSMLADKTIRKFVATNTVESDFSVVDIIPTAAEFYMFGIKK